MLRDKISLQLYSARAIDGLDAQLALAQKCGFTNVEPWGGLFADPALLKDLLAKHNLKAPSAHIGLDRLRADAAGTAKMFRGLGIDFLIAPAPPPDQRDMDRAGWQALGRELHAHGKAVTGEGLRFGWHNHHWEFKPLPDGSRPFDILMNEAPDMAWEADLAWIVRGNADPIAELARYSGRAKAAHVKDLAAQGQALDEDGWADAGHGTMDWAKLYPAMVKAGVQLFVLEHDKPSDAERFASRSLAQVANWPTL